MGYNLFMEILDIVDDNDNVIGKEPREMVHTQGLRHREIHVWFFNNKGQILFQKRGKNVDTAPGLLDASVGGHVDLGTTYKQSAINEVREETGLNIGEENLIFIDKIPAEHIDSLGLINKVFRSIFTYEYNGSIDELVPEEDKSDGFEWWDIEDVLNLSDGQKQLFVSAVTDAIYVDKVFIQIKKQRLIVSR